MYWVLLNQWEVRSGEALVYKFAKYKGESKIFWYLLSKVAEQSIFLWWLYLYSAFCWFILGKTRVEFTFVFLPVAFVKDVVRWTWKKRRFIKIKFVKHCTPQFEASCYPFYGIYLFCGKEFMWHLHDQFFSSWESYSICRVWATTIWHWENQNDINQSLDSRQSLLIT